MSDCGSENSSEINFLLLQQSVAWGCFMITFAISGALSWFSEWAFFEYVWKVRRLEVRFAVSLTIVRFFVISFSYEYISGDTGLGLYRVFLGVFVTSMIVLIFRQGFYCLFLG